MDIYVLNSDYSKESVIDEFESFIWTDRYSKKGDMQLVVRPTRQNKLRLKMGAYLIHTETDRPMIITHRLIAEDDDGVPKMTIKAVCFKELMDRRSLAPNTSGLDWRGKGTVSQILTNMVHQICVLGVGLSPSDIIPSFYTHNDVTMSENVDVALQPQSLYTAITELANSEDLGFTVELRRTEPKLRFLVYKGVVRRTVIFDSSLDNLSNEQHIISEENFKNVAYVWGKEAIAYEIYYGWNTSSTVSGVNRRVLTVMATDIDPKGLTDTEYRNQLKRRGKEALAENKFLRVFDGQITEVNPYTYGVHYQLGDIVHHMDDNDSKKQVRVTEYIWAWDNEGLRSYPTFEAIEV